MRANTAGRYRRAGAARYAPSARRCRRSRPPGTRSLRGRRGPGARSRGPNGRVRAPPVGVDGRQRRAARGEPCQVRWPVQWQSPTQTRSGRPPGFECRTADDRHHSDQWLRRGSTTRGHPPVPVPVRGSSRARGGQTLRISGARADGHDLVPPCRYADPPLRRRSPIGQGDGSGTRAPVGSAKVELSHGLTRSWPESCLWAGRSTRPSGRNPVR
jgi:hypothetical protein